MYRSRGELETERGDEKQRAADAFSLFQVKRRGERAKMKQAFRIEKKEKKKKAKAAMRLLFLSLALFLAAAAGAQSV